MSLTGRFIENVIQQHLVTAGFVVSQVVAFIYHHKKLVKRLNSRFGGSIIIIVQTVFLQIRVGTNDVLKPVFLKSGIGVHSVF